MEQSLAKRENHDIVDKEAQYKKGLDGIMELLKTKDYEEGFVQRALNLFRVPNGAVVSYLFSHPQIKEIALVKALHHQSYLHFVSGEDNYQLFKDGTVKYGEEVLRDDYSQTILATILFKLSKIAEQDASRDLELIEHKSDTLMLQGIIELIKQHPLIATLSTAAGGALLTWGLMSIKPSSDASLPPLPAISVPASSSTSSVAAEFSQPFPSSKVKDPKLEVYRENFSILDNVKTVEDWNKISPEDQKTLLMSKVNRTIETYEALKKKGFVPKLKIPGLQYVEIKTSLNLYDLSGNYVRKVKAGERMVVVSNVHDSDRRWQVMIGDVAYLQPSPEKYPRNSTSSILSLN